MDGVLFDASFLASLRGLRVRVRRTRAADRAGSRAGGGRGGRTEFTGHRSWVAGDEPRSVDWAASARAGRIVVKEYERESALRVTLALDASGSMGVFGKWDAARRVTAAIAAAALQSEARVDLHLLQDGPAPRLVSARGARGLPAVLDALARARCGGATALQRSVASLPRPAGRGTRLALVSDLLDEVGVATILAARCSRGEEPWIFEVVSPEERSPRERGTLILRDPEDPNAAALRVAVGDHEALLFEREVRRRLDEHRSLASRLGGVHGAAWTDAPAVEVVLAVLRASTVGGAR